MGRPRGRRLPDTTAARADRSNPHQPLRPFKRASGPSWDDGQSVERWSVLLTLERLTSKPPTGRPSTCVRPPHASLQPRSGVRPPYQQPIVVVGPDEIARHAARGATGSCLPSAAAAVETAHSPLDATASSSNLDQQPAAGSSQPSPAESGAFDCSLLCSPAVTFRSHEELLRHWEVTHYPIKCLTVGKFGGPSAGLRERESSRD
jgi:hypothetical protein